MKMKYTEQAVETLDDAGSVIANKNIEIEQLRQRVQELEELLKESYKDADEVLRPRVAELENERLEQQEKLCGCIVSLGQLRAERHALKQQRDVLVDHLENLLFWDNGKPEFDDARKTLANVKEK